MRQAPRSRNKWRITKVINLHLGARDPTTGGFVMLGKTFKGLTDEMLAWQTAEFHKLRIAPAENEDAGSWVVYLRPEVVKTRSTKFRKARNIQDFRFARVKGYRPDKRPEDADTIETVRKLYSAQVHAGGPL